MDYSSLCQAAQTFGVLLIAVMQWPIVSVIRTRFLEYWAWAWVALGVALLCLSAPHWFPPLAVLKYRVSLRMLYCICEYLFGLLVWAGTRNFVSGKALRQSDLYWLITPLLFAVIVPPMLSQVHDGIRYLFGWHSAILTVFFAASFWETLRARSTFGPQIGIRVFQYSILGLTLVFAHYAIVILLKFHVFTHWHLEYLRFTSLLDVILEAGLSFAMVTIATERMRNELIESNQKLAAAAAELTLAARTDPLTGLLNRRALDDLVLQPGSVQEGYLAAIDMNDLKQLNDQHGHESGDVALRLIARALRVHFRVTDPIFRLGGDEFLVLMPGGAMEELTRRMRSLDRSLLGQRLPGMEQPIDMSISWGLAHFPQPGAIPNALREADDVMYSQKKQRKSASIPFPTDRVLPQSG